LKDILVQLVKETADDFKKRSVAREYLQARILLALQDHGAFADWAFVGGTALRFLFQLPRYSEDLDFSLTEPGRDAQFVKRMRGVKSALEAEAYGVEIRLREQRTVAGAFVKFRGLLHEIGISPHVDEVLAVRVEIDTNPPPGAGLQTQVIRRFVLLNLLHYDKASMLGGKLHAVLARKYTKGRDLYDLAWYLADPSWPEPNLTLLNNALRQSGWAAAALLPETWRSAVAQQLETVDWKHAADDVSAFLERPQDAALVSADVLMELLRRQPGSCLPSSRFSRPG
jgi:hypothetical protein